MKMNKIHLVSFATTIEDIGFPDLELRQIRLNKTAKAFGIDETHSWTRQRLLKTEFYQKNKQILDYKKGAGFWLWKPYIIYDTLSKMNEGDYLFYCDNSLYFIDKFDDLLPICDENNGVMLFVMDAVENGSIRRFTKKRLFEITNTETLNYLDAQCVKANVYLFKKTAFSLAFAKEYLDWCLDRNKLLDEELLNLPLLEEDPIYIGKHNHDQGIISLLRVKYNLPGYRVLFQHGNHSKLLEFRIEGEWIMNEDYCNVFENSPYGQKMIWDKDGLGCERPISHYLSVNKLFGFIKRKLQK